MPRQHVVNTDTRAALHVPPRTRRLSLGHVSHAQRPGPAGPGWPALLPTAPRPACAPGATRPALGGVRCGPRFLKTRCHAADPARPSQDWLAAPPLCAPPFLPISKDCLRPSAAGGRLRGSGSGSAGTGASPSFRCPGPHATGSGPRAPSGRPAPPEVASCHRSATHGLPVPPRVPLSHRYPDTGLLTPNAGSRPVSGADFWSMPLRPSAHLDGASAEPAAAAIGPWHGARVPGGGVRLPPLGSPFSAQAERVSRGARVSRGLVRTGGCSEAEHCCEHRAGGGLCSQHLPGAPGPAPAPPSGLTRDPGEKGQEWGTPGRALSPEHLYHEQPLPTPHPQPQRPLDPAPARAASLACGSRTQGRPQRSSFSERLH